MNDRLIEVLKADAGFFIRLLDRGISCYDYQEEENFRLIGPFCSLEYIRMVLREFNCWTYESEFQEIKTKLIEFGIIKEEYL